MKQIKNICFFPKQLYKLIENFFFIIKFLLILTFLMVFNFKPYLMVRIKFFLFISKLIIRRMLYHLPW